MNESETKEASEAGRQQLRPNLTVWPLDDELVVFSEDAQCLIGLNTSAAFVFRELAKGTPASKLAQALVSEKLAAPAEAERWAAAALDALGAHGMLINGTTGATLPVGKPTADERIAARQVATMPPYTPIKPVEERRYRLLETCALIRYTYSAQTRLVDAVIGHLATDDSSVPDIIIEIQGVILEDGHLRSDIYRDGVPVGYAPRLSMLGPIVKAALWQSAVNAHDFLFYIHAGVVGTDEACVLLPAAAGSGKSSLTAALTHSGFRYFSDEVALIERTTFRVPPMPLAICVKSTGWDIMARYHPDISTLPTHGREDGKVVRYIPPPLGAAQQPPAPVSHIVFPRHEVGARTELKTVTRAEALGRLMGECLALRQRLDQENVAELVRWISAIHCYALTFSSLDEAVDLVTQVVKSEIR